MRLAVSNLALPPFKHVDLLPRLRELGVEGLEVAPDHTWTRSPDGISSCDVAQYRAAAAYAGLTIAGLHALLGGRPELGLFEDAETRRRTIDHLVHLSAVCRDLGGRTLILDSRWRRELPVKDAWYECRSFLEALLPRIEPHGTMMCFAPLAPDEGDFCNTAHDCLMMVNAVDHPSFGLHLGAKALAANGENGHATFAAVRSCLQHFHIDEPDGSAPGGSGEIDHANHRCNLVAIGFRGWASIVQHRIPGQDPLDAIERGVGFVIDRYFAQRGRPGDTTPGAERDRLRLIAATIEEVRPSIQGDGGDLELVAVEGQRIKVRLSGRCVSCGHAAQTLGGLRRKLMAVLKAPVMVVPCQS